MTTWVSTLILVCASSFYSGLVIYVPCLPAGHNIGDEEGGVPPCFPAPHRPQVWRCSRCGCTLEAYLSPRLSAATVHVVLVPRMCAPSGIILQSGVHCTSDGGHSSRGARAAHLRRLRLGPYLDCQVLPPATGGLGVPPDDCHVIERASPPSRLRPAADCLHPRREKLDTADILVSTVGPFSGSVALINLCPSPPLPGWPSYLAQVRVLPADTL
ncbi:hypothetical protein NDU88_000186 [Pleurodeles waltl]|uniref:Secreted protein n=1 Tax=Pleurodeles waltl TaxID=8319 RepID=A0AAV7S3V2_PLEWA|nr:hypothetical protein NDU88_000186 [Pleurodeles waltl]